MAEQFAPLATLLAMQQTLEKMAEGHTIPIRLRPNADQATVNKNFLTHLRSQMYLEGLA